MDYFLSSRQRELRARAETVALAHVAPHAEAVDRDCRWPEEAMRALAEAGLTGLHVPKRLGGEEQGLLGLVSVTEAIASACSSAAMCFGMHSVATAVIAAKATPQQEACYLRPIAEGRHITSLALSESGTGSHFYLANTALRREGETLVVEGVKQFVTSGGHADSYVVSTAASTTPSSSTHTGQDAPDSAFLEAGEFSCLLVDAGRPGMSWQEPWQGLGMRGNSSRALKLSGVRVPQQNLLGDEGDEIWYVFEVVAPYFLMAMSACYLGVAQAALDVTLQHLRSRRYAHSGETLAEIPVLQHKLAEMWAAVEKSRQLIYHAARLGDLGDPSALTAILASKVEVAETVVAVTNEAMTLCGGAAYRENSRLARLLRDARASHVMSPTTDILKQWAGRSLLGLPLL